MKCPHLITVAFVLSVTCACHKKPVETQPAATTLRPVPKHLVTQQVSYPCTVVYTGVLTVEGGGDASDDTPNWVDSLYSFMVTYLSKDTVIIKGVGMIPYVRYSTAEINDTLPNEEYIFGGNIYYKYNHGNATYGPAAAVHYEFPDGVMNASWSLPVYVPVCGELAFSIGSFSGTGKKLPRHP